MERWYDLKWNIFFVAQFTCYPPPMCVLCSQNYIRTKLSFINTSVTVYEDLTSDFEAHVLYTFTGFI